MSLFGPWSSVSCQSPDVRLPYWDSERHGVQLLNHMTPLYAWVSIRESLLFNCKRNESSENISNTRRQCIFHLYTLCCYYFSLSGSSIINCLCVMGVYACPLGDHLRRLRGADLWIEESELCSEVILFNLCLSWAEQVEQNRWKVKVQSAVWVLTHLLLNWESSGPSLSSGGPGLVQSKHTDMLLFIGLVLFTTVQSFRCREMSEHGRFGHHQTGDQYSFSQLLFGQTNHLERSITTMCPVSLFDSLSY